MSRRPLVAANWKLHKVRADVRAFAAAFEAGLADETAEVVVAPSAPLLETARAAFGPRVGILGQDASAHDQGAYTGEVSCAQLADTGCIGVILGHSERRQYHAETDASVRAKLDTALRHALMPVVCIGETLADREAGRTNDVVLGQLRGALEGFPAARLGTLVLAYEPVWAIGTGRNATPADAQAVHATIRADLSARLGADLALRTRILYGGSVKPENAADLLAEADVDGALVGGASLDAAAFLRIVRAAGSAAGTL